MVSLQVGETGSDYGDVINRVTINLRHLLGERVQDLPQVRHLFLQVGNDDLSSLIIYPLQW